MGSAEQPPGRPGEPPPPADGGEWETAGLGARVNEIVDAVEREAAKLRSEAEQEASQIRYQAQAEAQRYLDHARQQAEVLAAQRMERIQALSDQLMARAEEVLERLEYAVPVKEGFENLVRALGETAERLAREDYSEFAPPPWGDAPATAPPVPPPAPPVSPPPSPPSDATGGFAAPPVSQPPPVPQQPSPAPPAQPAPADAAQGPGWQELDDVHRIAIQMATAGSTRGEVEAHLAQTPAPTRGSVLDEIFGAGTGPETRVPWASPRR